MNQIQVPAGMKDTILQECKNKRFIQNQIEAIFASYGYEEVITPTIEFYETYENALDVNSTDFYKFFDETGNILALRMDMTVPIARVCASKFKDSKPPFRFRYASSVFKVRQKFAGRYGEVMDCGVECIGLDQRSDAQVLSCALDVLALFDEYTLEIGDAKFFEKACKLLNLDDETRRKLGYLIDKKSMVDLQIFVDSLCLDKEKAKFFMQLPFLCGHVSVLDEARDYCFDPELVDVIDSLSACIDVLIELGYKDHLSIDLAKIAHLDYYTGIIFEGFVPGIGVSILSGGRYDHLLDTFGLNLPACGFSVKIDPLMEKISAPSKKKYILYYPLEKQALAIQKAKLLQKDGMVCLEPSDVDDIEIKEVGV